MLYVNHLQFQINFTVKITDLNRIFRTHGNKTQGWLYTHDSQVTNLRPLHSTLQSRDLSSSYTCSHVLRGMQIRKSNISYSHSPLLEALKYGQQGEGEGWETKVSGRG